MSRDIKTHAKGHTVCFMPVGEGRWTVVHHGRSFEVERHRARDDHGWMRSHFSVRSAETSGVYVARLADLTAAARFICGVVC